MPTQNDFQNDDERYNPSEDAARSLFDREQDAGSNDDYGLSSRQQKKLDKKLANADKQLQGYNPSSDDNLKNIDDVRQREAALTNGLYVGAGKAEKKETVSVKGIFKKRGPLAAIISVGLGLPTLLAIFLSPALVLQQFAETMTGKFNDQLAALDVRSTLLLKKKYNSTITKGTCGTKITIHCRYQSIRENSGLAKRLRNAGVEIEGDKSIIPGRVKPSAFIFEGKTIPAGDLIKEARVNPNLRAALRKGYDPLFAGFSDKISAKVRVTLGLKKSSNVRPSTDEKAMNEDLKKTASGTNDLPDGAAKLTEVKDEEGKLTGYVDADGTQYSVEAGQTRNNLISESLGRDNLADKLKDSSIKSGVKGALTATAFGAGAVDSACSAWVMIRVAAFAAKYYQQRQLIRYAYEFMKVSHKQKFGDMKAEEMDYFGKKLTEVNSEGKAALDSSGYKFAAYGDTFKPSNFKTLDGIDKDGDLDAATEKIMVENESSRYINGQLLNSNIMSKLVGAISNGDSGSVEKADEVCKFTKSWKGQALVFGLAAAGAVVAFFTGGLSAGAGLALQASVSIAISVAFALLQPKLIDMAKGEVIKGDENGNETGNAVASGMGGYNAQTAQGRGLRVAEQESYSAYNQSNLEIAARYAAEDRAERSPFDATSKNTFLGGIVANILPFSTKMQNPGSSVLALTSMVGASLSSFGSPQKVSAADNNSQYTQCDDNEYKGLAADPFCNLRYMLPDSNKDPDDVLQYMIIGKYITEDDATPLNEYAEYVEKCIDRKTSIGDNFTNYKDGESEGGGDPGTDCVVGKGGENEERNNMFALFYVDTSVDEGLDNDFDEVIGDPQTENTGAGANIRIASFNLRGASHDGEDGTPPWPGRAQLSLKAIKDKQVDIIGFQEFEPPQRDFMKKNLPNFQITTHGKMADGLMWNTDKYTKVDQGTWETIYFEGPINEPWIRLKDKSTGQEFYVMNAHDPINKGQGNPTTRLQNARAHAEKVKELKTKAPVLLTGDFNSAFSRDAGSPALNDESLTYCVLTSSGVLNNAYDLSVPRKAKCPNKPNGRNYVDHIYLTPEIEVTSFKDVGSGYSSNGSDHPMVYADVVIPGAETGEVAWPLSKSLWNSNKADFLNAHGSTGTAWGGDNMGTSGKGPNIAADIGASVGTPVYAMVGGKVTSVSLCGANDGIAIKSNIGGKTLGIAYMHGKDKLFEVGDTVKAGDRIMSVGVIGCNVYGAHLHIGIAYGGTYVCPQDVFLALDKNESVNWGSLPAKATSCGR